MKPFAIIEKKTKPREDPDRYRIVGSTVFVEKY